jgi:hypothetical protein
MWKIGHFCKFQCESVSGTCRLRQRFRTQIQEALLRCQVAQEMLLLLERRVQQGMTAQQHGGVRQQGHAPSQPQAVEKHLAQAQLVFLVRLCRLDPRAHLLEQPLSGQAGQGQQPEQSFVVARSKREFPFTSRCSPAALANVRLATDTKPMAIFQRSIFQPTQRLTLRALGSVPGNIGRHQIHVGLQFGHYRHPPIFPTSGFGFSRQIAHIRHDNRRPPRPAPLAVTQAGHQESALRNIGRSGPTHQRHQHYCWGVFTPPQPECVLLVAHKATALPGLERATSQRCPMGGVALGFFFLKPPHDAGKSVASMRATAWDQPAARSIKGSRNWSLIALKPATPARARNSLSMRTSGPRCRWDSRPNSRQARCSGSRAVNWLKEWVGVSTASRWTRHNCAALKVRCGPRLARWFQCWLIKSSGTYGSTSVRNCAVPVSGSAEFMAQQATPLNSTCLPKAQR